VLEAFGIDRMREWENWLKVSEDGKGQAWILEKSASHSPQKMHGWIVACSEIIPFRILPVCR
jgi:hypothetical protein